MKLISFLAGLLFSSTLFAQSFSKDLDELVKVERAFSSLAAEKGIAPSFIANLSPTATLLQAGKEFNGMESMKKSQPDTADKSVVTWEPAFADISSSGNFGFTTGAVKIIKGNTDTTYVAGFTYTSIWERDEAGKWKLIFDLGSGSGSRKPGPLTFSDYPLKKAKTKPDKAAEFKRLTEIDNHYNEALSGKSISFDPLQFSPEGRMHRSATEPIIGTKAIESYNDRPNRIFIFKTVNGKIANSADLAYTYGTMDAAITENGQVRNVSIGYLRIWKKYGSEWKVLVDVIG